MWQPQTEKLVLSVTRHYQPPVETRLKEKQSKGKNQREGQEVISTSGKLEQVSDINSGREATLQDGGKPKDEERGGVESEGERERGAGDEGRGCRV
ncbi:unnamed protein product [Coregonus sp. 'balchen']|nr:unnamed protein product [Coregonus sp. 'balchen']